jgi:hypothetical protein
VPVHRMATGDWQKPENRDFDALNSCDHLL